LLLQLLGQPGVGVVGVDDLEQPLAGDLQLFGAELLGELEHVQLGLLPLFWCHGGGQGADGVDDDLGLGDGDPAGGQRDLGAVEHGGQPVSEVDLASGAGPVAGGGLCPPRLGGVRGRLPDVGAVGLVQQPQPQRGDPGLGPRQLHRSRARGLGRQPGGGDHRDLVEDLVHPVREERHRVPHHPRCRLLRPLVVPLVWVHEGTL
jgi:hypothetical protein